MNNLIAIGFKDEFAADAVILELRKLGRDNLINLEDAVIVIRDEDGKVRIKRTQRMTTSGALSGSLWGILVGAILFNPVLGLVFGALVGVVSGALTDNFIREVGSTILLGTSAMFVLIRESTPDQVLTDLSRFEGKVLRTSLSPEDEAKLQAVLTAEPHYKLSLN
jgi:uncharacterized membrane protein